MNDEQIDREIAERRVFLEKLHELGRIGDEYSLACDAEIEASNRRNAARDSYRKCWAEMKSQFPNRRMPIFAESIWGPEPSADSDRRQPTHED